MNVKWGSFLVMGAAFLWASDGLFRYPVIASGVRADLVVFYEHVFLLVVTTVFYVGKLGKSRKISFSLPPPSHCLFFFLLGGVGAGLATFCYTNAFSLINPSVVILLQKLQHFVAIPLAYLVLKEPLSKGFLLWAFVCVGGALLISYSDLSVAFSLEKVGTQPLRGYLYTFLAVFGWGACTVWGKKLILLGYDTGEIMWGRYVIAVFTLLPLILLSGHLSVPPEALGKIALMAFLSGLLALILYYEGLKFIPARLCTLLELTYPVWAVMVNWVFLGLTISSLQILGSLILLAGVSMVQRKIES